MSKQQFEERRKLCMGLFKRKGRLSFESRKRKYAREIRTKVETKKNGKPYRDKNGKTIPLSDTQLSFRSGYFTAIRDMFRSQRKQKNQKQNVKTNNPKMNTYEFEVADRFGFINIWKVKGKNREDAFERLKKEMEKSVR